jgi:hypothetical protein
METRLIKTQISLHDFLLLYHFYHCVKVSVVCGGLVIVAPHTLLSNKHQRAALD